MRPRDLGSAPDALVQVSAVTTRRDGSWVGRRGEWCGEVDPGKASLWREGETPLEAALTRGCRDCAHSRVRCSAVKGSPSCSSPALDLSLSLPSLLLQGKEAPQPSYTPELCMMKSSPWKVTDRCLIAIVSDLVRNSASAASAEICHTICNLIRMFRK